MAPSCRLAGYRQDCPSSLPEPDYYLSVKAAHECTGAAGARIEYNLIVPDFDKLRAVLCRNLSTSRRYQILHYCS